MLKALRRFLEYLFTPEEPRWLVTLVDNETHIHHELGEFEGSREAAFQWAQIGLAWLSVERGEPVFAAIRIERL